MEKYLPTPSRILLKILLLLVLYSSMGMVQASAQISGTPPAPTIPHFQLFRYDGEAFTERNLPHDKLIFFMFVDPTCDHCQEAIGNLGDQFKAFQHTAVYLVSVYGKDKMDPFMDTYGAKVKGRKNVWVLHDKLGEFMKDFNPVRYPAMFLYSPQGKLLDYEDNPLTLFRIVNTIQRNTKPSN